VIRGVRRLKIAPEAITRAELRKEDDPVFLSRDSSSRDFVSRVQARQHLSESFIAAEELFCLQILWSAAHHPSFAALGIISASFFLVLPLLVGK